jgi:hypothetical protein
LLGIVVAIAVPVVGGILRWLVKQIDQARSERDVAEAKADAQRERYDAKLALAEKALETKSETVDELRRQVDRYLITAEIQDRFFKQIPPPASSGER